MHGSVCMLCKPSCSAPGPTHLVHQPQVIALDGPPHRTPGHKALGRGLQIGPPLDGLILQSPRAQQHLQGVVRTAAHEHAGRQVSKASKWVGAWGGRQAAQRSAEERCKARGSPIPKRAHLDIAVCRADGVVPQLPRQLVMVPDSRHILQPGMQSRDGAHTRAGQQGLR